MKRLGAVVVCCVVAGAALVGSGGASTKNWCKGRDWANVYDVSGGSFPNQGQCVSYVAHGGKLYVQSSITLTVGPVFADPYSLQVSSTSEVDMTFNAAAQGVKVAALDGNLGDACSLIVVAGKGSCALPLSVAGTWDVIATFAGDTKTDPGLLPSTAKATIVVPCIENC